MYLRCHSPTLKNDNNTDDDGAGFGGGDFMVHGKQERVSERHVRTDIVSQRTKQTQQNCREDDAMCVYEVAVVLAADRNNRSQTPTLHTKTSFVLPSPQ